jgi:hypothetical protein
VGAGSVVVWRTHAFERMEKFEEDTVKIERSGYHEDDTGGTDGGITVVVGKANVDVIFF